MGPPGEGCSGWTKKKRRRASMPQMKLSCINIMNTRATDPGKNLNKGEVEENKDRCRTSRTISNPDIKGNCTFPCPSGKHKEDQHQKEGHRRVVQQRRSKIRDWTPEAQDNRCRKHQGTNTEVKDNRGRVHLRRPRFHFPRSELRDHLWHRQD